MASFTININAEPSVPYGASTDPKWRQGDCLTGITGIPLGLVESIDTPSTFFLLDNYTGGNPWKTLNISNLTYTESPDFTLEYNSVTLTPNVDPNVVIQAIPITGILENQAIPLFFANYDNDNLSSNGSIAFDLEIIDSADVSLGKVRVGIIILYVECIPPIVKEKISTVSENTTSCFTERIVTVKVPAEGSRYVYGVISDGFGSISGTLPATITADTNYTLRIEGSNAGSTNGVYSVVQIFSKDSASDTTVNAQSTISRNHSGNIC